MSDDHPAVTRGQPMRREGEFCPLEDIDWEFVFYQGRRPVIGNGEPDPDGEWLGIDGLVQRYQAAYPDDRRQAWIEQRLRKWFAQREAP